MSSYFFLLDYSSGEMSNCILIFPFAKAKCVKRKNLLSSSRIKREMKLPCDAADPEAAHGFPHANNLTTTVPHKAAKND